MSKKLVLKPTEAGRTFNSSSAVIAYASKLVDKKMAKAFELFKDTSKSINKKSAVNK